MTDHLMSVCPACDGTGDQWTEPRFGVLPEPFPCSDCNGVGERAVRPPARVSFVCGPVVPGERELPF